jgi:hypothetical protein
MKTNIAWFIDCSKMKSYEVTAKLKQLNDYIGSSKFFNKYNVLVIPSTENKFQIIDGELPKDEKELENILHSIKSKLKDCITKYI